MSGKGSRRFDIVLGLLLLAVAAAICGAELASFLRFLLGLG